MRPRKFDCEPLAGEVRLIGGPFDTIIVPKPSERWGRINVEDRDNRGVVHVYRPKRDGSYVYEGTSRVILRVPKDG